VVTAYIPVEVLVSHIKAMAISPSAYPAGIFNEGVPVVKVPDVAPDIYGAEYAICYSAEV
jgi:hypothetical protein